MVSFIAGLLVARAFGHSPVVDARTQLKVLGGISFLLQSIAYAANDGQKMLALLAIALGLGVNGRIVAGPGPQVLLGVLLNLCRAFETRGRDWRIESRDWRLIPAVIRMCA